MERIRLSRGRLLALAFLSLLALSLLAAGVAMAATSQDIYNDFAADGKLDGTYTDAELQAVLDDPTLAQYADPTVYDQLKDLIRSGSGDSSSRSVFPFTGSQLVFMVGGGVVLVGLGVLLRRGRRGEDS